MPPISPQPAPCCSEEFCFVHVPKTGGVSVIHQITKAADPQTMVHKRNLVRARLKESQQWFTVIGHDSRRPNSVTLAEYKAKIPRCFSFAFVRHPFARLISAYEYLRAGGLTEEDRVDAEKYLANVKDFKTFVVERLGTNYLNILNQVHFRPQHSWVCDANGRCLLDFVGHTERLDEDFATICSYMRIDAGKLPRLNSSPRLNDSAYFTEETRRVAAAVYRADFEAFKHIPKTP